MTTLVFPHVEGNWKPEECAMQRDLARIMIASAKRHMPGVRIAMWTDPNTPAIDGVDDFLRRSITGWSWIPWVCHCASEMQGEVLYVDTDIVIQRDLRPLFNVPFDALFTYRGMKLIDGTLQPFIFGVVPYRTPEFWIEVRDRVQAMPKVEQGWYGSQIAVGEMWMEERNGRGKWQIASVDRETYNYTPKEEDEIPAGKWVLHYKGRKRKAWMLKKWGHLLAEERAAA